MTTILIFTILSLINVILSTLRSIYTIKGTKLQSCFMNAISYGFYTIIVKQITGLDLTVTVTVTILCNLIGVYLATWICEKNKKDKLWVISVTAEETSADCIANQLKNMYIKYRMFDLNTFEKAIDIYSQTQEESAYIKEILKQHNVKYNVSEVMQRL